MFVPSPRSRVALLLSALSAAALTGCFATRLDAPLSGYTCCNLHAEAGWVSSDNVQGRGGLLPLGSPVQLQSIKKKYYVYGTVGDAEVAFRDDAAKTEQDTLQWARRLVVPEDPRQRLAGWPAEVRMAVEAGRVLVGMTRDQVAMAIGYPSANDTRDLNADTWRYWTSFDDTPVDLTFSADGSLARLSGSPNGLRLVAFQR